jgi:hypothetical protein
VPPRSETWVLGLELVSVGTGNEPLEAEPLEAPHNASCALGLGLGHMYDGPVAPCTSYSGTTTRQPGQLRRL